VSGVGCIVGAGWYVVFAGISDGSVKPGVGTAGGMYA
jgi:hypothetical protein